MYFSFFQQNKFRDFQKTVKELEECMSIYFGEAVTIRLEDAKWLVKEYSFTEGAYVMGLQCGRTTTFFSNLFEEHYMTVNDASEQKIYQLYKRYEKKG